MSKFHLSVGNGATYCPACALLEQPGLSKEVQADPEEASSGDMLGSGDGSSDATLKGGEVRNRELGEEMEQGACPEAAGGAKEGQGLAYEKRMKAVGPDPQKCKWPLLHKSLIEYRDFGTFCHVN